MPTATSSDGTVSVRTTDQGLPLAARIDPAELRQDPQELARKVLRVCRQAANRAGLALRTELAAGGMSSEVMALLNLPKPEDVAREEMAEELDYGFAPTSWVKRT